MRMRRNTINTLLVIGFLVIGAIVVLNINSQARLNRFIAERNAECNNLTIALRDEQGLDCFCYFDGFKTGNEMIDEKTLPYCACDCVINGTRVSIGLVEPVK